jgi:peptidyl-prolyl cis-trans isomerase B (cyclophilin B)
MRKFVLLLHLQFADIYTTIKENFQERTKYMKSKRIISILLSAVLISASAAALTACGEDNKNTTEATEAATAASAKSSPAVEDLKKSGVDVTSYGVDPDITYAEDEDYGFQLEKPKKGDKVAIMHTNYGDISLKLFDKYAPNTVKNFIDIAKSGKYNKSIFHRVIKDFMIQGGDYENFDGTGGKTANGDTLEDEFCDKLLNLRGSVAMANSGKDTNGSQFFINQNDKDAFKANGGFDTLVNNWEKNIKPYFTNNKDNSTQLSSVVAQIGTSAYDADVVPKEVKKLYEKNGGNASLDGAYNAVDAGHTVFAQVYDGMDVVDKIAKVKTDASDKPEKDVTIKSIEIKEYK